MTRVLATSSTSPFPINMSSGTSCVSTPVSLRAAATGLPASRSKYSNLMAERGPRPIPAQACPAIRASPGAVACRTWPRLRPLPVPGPLRRGRQRSTQDRHAALVLDSRRAGRAWAGHPGHLLFRSPPISPALRSTRSIVSTTVRDLYTTPTSIICRVLRCGLSEAGDSRSSITPSSLR